MTMVVIQGGITILQCDLHIKIVNLHLYTNAMHSLTPPLSYCVSFSPFSVGPGTMLLWLRSSPCLMISDMGFCGHWSLSGRGSGIASPPSSNATTTPRFALCGTCDYIYFNRLFGVKGKIEKGKSFSHSNEHYGTNADSRQISYFKTILLYFQVLRLSLWA